MEEFNYRIGQEVVHPAYSSEAATLTLETMPDDNANVVLKRTDRQFGFHTYVLVDSRQLGKAKPKAFKVETDWRVPEAGDWVYDKGVGFRVAGTIEPATFVIVKVVELL